VLADVVIVDAVAADAAEILALQKLAYLSEAALYDDYTIPPLTQTMEGMLQDIEEQLVLKADLGGRIVGSVRAHQREGVCFIGRLIVHPDSQNRGIGASLMRAIEARFADAQRFELFTGDRSTKNVCFYQKLGYEITRRGSLPNNVTLVYLQKDNDVHPGPLGGARG
jgi:N-acetylglutamate synthase-like GNAT family acetyltransferase